MRRNYKKKDPPVLLPCRCGDIGITLRPRGGAWSVHCLSRSCDCMVRGYETEEAALLAWNKEVTKK